jgi:hypothetical protein
MRHSQQVDRTMMGERLVMQESLFYAFRLEDHVPSDHLLRRIDRFVDCSGLRQHLAGDYSTIGRPSVDPELMIRMLLIGYCLGIRSERRLCEEVHLNLAFAGSAVSGWTARCPTTPHSPRTGTAAFVNVTCSVTCSRRWCSAAWTRGWSVVKALPWTLA